MPARPYAVPGTARGQTRAPGSCARAVPAPRAADRRADCRGGPHRGLPSPPEAAGRGERPPRRDRPVRRPPPGPRHPGLPGARPGAAGGPPDAARLVAREDRDRQRRPPGLGRHRRTPPGPGVPRRGSAWRVPCRTGAASADPDVGRHRGEPGRSGGEAGDGARPAAGGRCGADHREDRGDALPPAPGRVLPGRPAPGRADPRPGPRDGRSGADRARFCTPGSAPTG